MGTSTSAMDRMTKRARIPSHVEGAAQKIRQLSPHQAMPSPAARRRGSGAVVIAISPAVVDVDCDTSIECALRGSPARCRREPINWLMLMPLAIDRPSRNCGAAYGKRRVDLGNRGKAPI
jgi:hypothetical protein